MEVSLIVYRDFCFPSRERFFNDKDIIEFMVFGILMNLIGVIGIIGNMISILVISRTRIKSSMNYLTVGLAWCDTSLILFLILLKGIPEIHKYTWSNDFLYMLLYVIDSLGLLMSHMVVIVRIISVYLTLKITLERYVAVCRPFKAKLLCTYTRAKCCCIMVIISSTLYNLSRLPVFNIYLEHAVATEEIEYRHCYSKFTLRGGIVHFLVNNQWLLISWLYFVFIYLVPITCMVAFNIAIYKQLNRANQDLERLSRVQKKIGQPATLLLVAVTFELSHILSLVSFVLEEFCNVLIFKLTKTVDFIVLFNSSVNFLIYVVFVEKYQRLFLNMVSCNSVFTKRDSPNGETVQHNQNYNNCVV